MRKREEREEVKRRRRRVHGELRKGIFFAGFQDQQPDSQKQRPFSFIKLPLLPVPSAHSAFSFVFLFTARGIVKRLAGIR